jgi:hypothetical protein
MSARGAQDRSRVQAALDRAGDTTERVRRRLVAVIARATHTDRTSAYDAAALISRALGISSAAVRIHADQPRRGPVIGLAAVLHLRKPAAPAARRRAVCVPTTVGRDAGTDRQRRRVRARPILHRAGGCADAASALGVARALVAEALAIPIAAARGCAKVGLSVGDHEATRTGPAVSAVGGDAAVLEFSGWMLAGELLPRPRLTHPRTARGQLYACATRAIGRTGACTRQHSGRSAARISAGRISAARISAGRTSAARISAARIRRCVFPRRAAVRRRASAARHDGQSGPDEVAHFGTPHRRAPQDRRHDTHRPHVESNWHATRARPRDRPNPT